MARDIVLSIDGDTRPLVRRLNKDISRASRSASFEMNDKNFSQPLGRITGQLGEFDRALDASNARVLAFAASAGVLLVVQKGFQAVFSSMVNVEKKLADINVLFGASEKSLAKFGNSLFGVASETAQGFDEVAVAATELARQGLSAEETLKRTRDALILVRLTGMDAAEAVQAVTAALNSFSRAAIDSTEYVSKLAAVDAAFAVGSDDLAAAVSRVGSSAQEAGVSLDQLIAIVTAAQQITARGGAVIGNSFKTIFTRIQRPRVLKQLEELGIRTQDLGGKIRPALTILKELAQTYDLLAQSQQAQIAELIGGVFQVNVLKASLRDLGKEFSLYNNALNISNNATDEAIRRNEELNKTVSASLNQVVQNFTKFGAQAGKAILGPLTKNVSTGINAVIGEFSLDRAEKNIEDDSRSLGNKIVSGIFKGVGKFLGTGGIIIGIKILFNTFREFTRYAIDGVKKLGAIGGQTRDQIELQGQVTRELEKQPELLRQLVNGEIDAKEAADKLYSSLKQNTQELKIQKDLVESFAYAMSAKGVRIAPTTAGATTIDPASVANVGFVPNFTSTKDSIAAAVELSSASYANSSTKAIKTNIDGIGSVMTNSKEKIVKHPSFKQPFVNPPITSPEGRAHKRRSIDKTGVDPYKHAFGGFIPNFALDPEKIVGKLDKKSGKRGKTLRDQVASVKRDAGQYLDAKQKMDLFYEKKETTGFKSLNDAAGALGVGDRFFETSKYGRYRLAALVDKFGGGDVNNLPQVIRNHADDLKNIKAKDQEAQSSGKEFEQRLASKLNYELVANEPIDFGKGIGNPNGIRSTIGMEDTYAYADAIDSRRGHEEGLYLDKVLRWQRQQEGTPVNATSILGNFLKGEQLHKFGNLSPVEVIGVNSEAENVGGRYGVENEREFFPWIDSTSRSKGASQETREEFKKANEGGVPLLESVREAATEGQIRSPRISWSYDRDNVSTKALGMSGGHIPNFEAIAAAQPLPSVPIESNPNWIKLKEKIDDGIAKYGFGDMRANLIEDSRVSIDGINSFLNNGTLAPTKEDSQKKMQDASYKGLYNFVNSDVPSQKRIDSLIKDARENKETVDRRLLDISTEDVNKETFFETLKTLAGSLMMTYGLPVLIAKAAKTYPAAAVALAAAKTPVGIATGVLSGVGLASLAFWKEGKAKNEAVELSNGLEGSLGGIEDYNTEHNNLRKEAIVKASLVSKPTELHRGTLYSYGDVSSRLSENTKAWPEGVSIGEQDGFPIWSAANTMFYKGKDNTVRHETLDNLGGSSKDSEENLAGWPRLNINEINKAAGLAKMRGITAAKNSFFADHKRENINKINGPADSAYVKGFIDNIKGIRNEINKRLEDNLDVNSWTRPDHIVSSKGYIPNFETLDERGLPPLPTNKEMEVARSLKKAFKNKQIVKHPTIGPRGKHYVAMGLGSRAPRYGGGVDNRTIPYTIISASAETAEETGYLSADYNKGGGFLTPFFDGIMNYNNRNIDQSVTRGSGLARFSMLQKFAREKGASIDSESIVTNPNLLKNVEYKHKYGTRDELINPDDKYASLREEKEELSEKIRELRGQYLKNRDGDEELNEPSGIGYASLPDNNPFRGLERDFPASQPSEKQKKLLKQIQKLEGSRSEIKDEKRQRIAELIEENFKNTQADKRSAWAKLIEIIPQLKYRMGKAGGEGVITQGEFYSSLPKNETLPSILDPYEFKSLNDLRNFVYNIVQKHGASEFNKHIVGLVDDNNDGKFDAGTIPPNLAALGKSLGVSELKTIPIENLPAGYFGGKPHQDDSNVPFNSKGFVPNFVKFNPSNPPALRKPAIALKLKNKEIHYDPDSLMHYQAAENLNILPEEILEHGFINKGKYESSFFSDFEKIADRQKAGIGEFADASEALGIPRGEPLPRGGIVTADQMRAPAIDRSSLPRGHAPMRGPSRPMRYGGFVPNFLKIPKATSEKGGGSLHVMLAEMLQSNAGKVVEAVSKTPKLFNKFKNSIKLREFGEQDTYGGITASEGLVPNFLNIPKPTSEKGGGKLVDMILDTPELLMKFKDFVRNNMRETLEAFDKWTDTPSELAQKYIDGNLYRGYIPNFSSALGDAINREKSAGISSSSIRVDSDPSLKTKQNPMGLGVYNTKQETSLKQGIKFSKQAGIDPKTKGAFRGHIPNFAADRAPAGGLEFQGKEYKGGQFMPEGSVDTALLTSINNALKGTLDKAKEMTSSMSQAVSGIEGLQKASSQMADSMSEAVSGIESLHQTSTQMADSMGDAVAHLDDLGNGIMGLQNIQSQQLTAAQEGLKQAKNQSINQYVTAVKTSEIAASMQAQADLAQQQEDERQRGLQLEKDRNKRIAANVKDAGTTALNILSTGFEGAAPAGAPEIGIKKLGEDSDVKTSLGDRLKTDLGAFKIEEKHDVDQSAAAQEAYDRLSAAVRAASQAAEQETKKIEGLVPKDLQGKFQEFGSLTDDAQKAIAASANNMTVAEFENETEDEQQKLKDALAASVNHVNKFNANQETYNDAISDAEKQLKAANLTKVDRVEIDPAKLAQKQEAGTISVDELKDAQAAVSRQLRQMDSDIADYRRTLDEGTTFTPEGDKLQSQAAMDAEAKIKELNDSREELADKLKQISKTTSEATLKDLEASSAQVKEALDKLGKNASSMDFTDLIQRETKDKNRERAIAGKGKGIGTENVSLGGIFGALGKKFTQQADASDDVQQKMFFMSSAISTVSGMFDSFGEEGAALNKGISGMTDGVNTATGIISTLPGPWGKAVGIVAGVGVALNGVAKAISSNKLDVAGLKKKADQAGEKFTELSNNITAYASAFSELQSAAADMNTPADQIIRLNKKLEDLIASVPPKFAADLAAITDPADLQAKVAEIIAGEQKKTKSIEFAASSAERMDANAGISNLYGFASPVAQFDGKEGAVNLERAAGDLSQLIDFEKLQNGLGKASTAMEKDATERLLSANSASEMANAMKQGFGATEELANSIRQMNQGDLQILRKRLVDMANAARRAREAMEKVAAERAKVSTDLEIPKLQLAIQAATINVEQEEQMLGTAGGGIEGFKDPQSLNAAFDSFTAALGQLTAQTTSPGAQGAATGQGRAVLGLVEGLRDIAGIIPTVDDSGQMTSEFKDFRDTVAAGIEESIREQTKAQLKQAQAQMAVATDSDDIRQLESVIGLLQNRLSDADFISQAAMKQADEAIGTVGVEVKTIQIPAEGSTRIGETIGTTMEGFGVTGAKADQTLIDANDEIAYQLQRMQKREAELEKKKKAGTLTDDEKQEQADLATAIKSLTDIGTVTKDTTAGQLQSLQVVDAATGEIGDLFKGDRMQVGGDLTPAQKALMRKQDELRIATDKLAEATRDAAAKVKEEQEKEVAREGGRNLLQGMTQTQQFVTGAGTDSLFGGAETQAELDQGGFVARAIQEQAGNLGILNWTEMGGLTKADRGEAASEFIMGEREVGDTGVKSMEGLVEAMRVVSQKAEESAGRELGVGDLQSLAFGNLDFEGDLTQEGVRDAMMEALKTEMNIKDEQAAELLDHIFKVFKNDKNGANTNQLLKSILASTNKDEFQKMDKMAEKAVQPGSIYTNDQKGREELQKLREMMAKNFGQSQEDVEKAKATVEKERQENAVKIPFTNMALPNISDLSAGNMAAGAVTATGAGIAGYKGTKFVAQAGKDALGAGRQAAMRGMGSEKVWFGDERGQKRGTFREEYKKRREARKKKPAADAPDPKATDTPEPKSTKPKAGADKIDDLRGKGPRPTPSTTGTAAIDDATRTATTTAETPKSKPKIERRLAGSKPAPTTAPKKPAIRINRPFIEGYGGQQIDPVTKKPNVAGAVDDVAEAGTKAATKTTTATKGVAKGTEAAAKSASKLTTALKVAGKAAVVVDAALVGWDAYKVTEALATGNFDEYAQAYEDANKNAGILTRSLNGMSSPITAVATDIKIVSDTFSAYSDAAQLAADANKKMGEQIGKSSENIMNFGKQALNVTSSSVDSSVVGGIASHIMAQNEAAAREGKGNEAITMLQASGGLGKEKHRIAELAGSRERAVKESGERARQRAEAELGGEGGMKDQFANLLEVGRLSTGLSADIRSGKGAFTLARPDYDDNQMKLSDLKKWLETNKDMRPEDRVKGMRQIDKAQAMGITTLGGLRGKEKELARQIEFKKTKIAEEELAKSLSAAGINIEEFTKKMGIDLGQLALDLTNDADIGQGALDKLGAAVATEVTAQETAKVGKERIEQFKEQSAGGKFSVLDDMTKRIEELRGKESLTKEETAELQNLQAGKTARLANIRQIQGTQGDAAAAEYVTLLERLDQMNQRKADLQSQGISTDNVQQVIDSITTGLSAYGFGNEATQKKDDLEKMQIAAMTAGGKSGAANTITQNNKELSGLNEELRDLELSAASDDSEENLDRVKKRRDELMARKAQIEEENKSIKAETLADPKVYAAFQEVAAKDQGRASRDVDGLDAAQRAKVASGFRGRTDHGGKDQSMYGEEDPMGVLGKEKSVTPVFVVNWPQAGIGQGAMGGDLPPVVKALQASMGDQVANTFHRRGQSLGASGGAFGYGGIGGAATNQSAIQRFVTRGQMGDTMSSAMSNAGYRQSIAQQMGAFSPLGGARTVGAGGPMTSIESMPQAGGKDVPLRIDGIFSLNENILKLNESIRAAFLGETAGPDAKTTPDEAAVEAAAETVAAEAAEVDTSGITESIEALKTVLTESNESLSSAFTENTALQYEQFAAFVSALGGLVSQLSKGATLDINHAITHAGSIDTNVIGGAQFDALQDGLGQVAGEVGVNLNPTNGGPTPPAGGTQPA